MIKLPSCTEYAALGSQTLKGILTGKRKRQKIISCLFFVCGVGGLLLLGFLGWIMFAASGFGSVIKFFDVIHFLFVLSLFLASALNSIQMWQGFIVCTVLGFLCGFENPFFFIIAVPAAAITIYARNICLDLQTLMAMKDYPFNETDKANAERGLAYTDRKAFMGIDKSRTDEQVVYYDENNLRKSENPDEILMEEINTDVYDDSNLCSVGQSESYMQATDSEYKDGSFSGGSYSSTKSAEEIETIEENYKDL